MREIIIQLSETYAKYRGNGKLAVLFLAAVICLIFIRKNNRGRNHQLLFVVSFFTGIAAAILSLVEKAFAGRKKIYGVIALLFAFFAISVSGSRIWALEFTDNKDAIKASEIQFDAVASYLAGLEDNPKILADYSITSELTARSSHLVPLYHLDSTRKISELEPDDRKLYEAISDRHPKMEQITRLARKEGHYFVLVDKTCTWPERATEGMYSLINTIGNIDIYEYGGTAYE